jgi:hypothetical protein
VLTYLLSPLLILGFTWNQNALGAFMVLRDRPQVLYIFGKLINKRKDWGFVFALRRSPDLHCYVLSILSQQLEINLWIKHFSQWPLSCSFKKNKKIKQNKILQNLHSNPGENVVSQCFFGSKKAGFLRKIVILNFFQRKMVFTNPKKREPKSPTPP